MLKGIVLILVCAFIVMLAWSDVSTTSASASPTVEAWSLLQERANRIGVLGGPRCLVPDEENPGLDRVTCDKFGERRAFISDESGKRIPSAEAGAEVWIKVVLTNVTCTGYYVVHFWPHGRHAEPLEALVVYEIGRLEDGGEFNGMFGPYRFPAGKTTFNYTIDVDIFRSKDQVASRADVLANNIPPSFVGQCDHPGEFTIITTTTTSSRTTTTIIVPSTTTTTASTSTSISISTSTTPQCVCRVGRDESGNRCELRTECDGGLSLGSDDYAGRCSDRYKKCRQ